MPGLRRSTLLSLALIPLLLIGCHGRHQVDRKELRELNRYGEGQTIPLQTIKGEWVKFSQETPLAFTLADGTVIREKYLAVKIYGGSFFGRTLEGSVIQIDLDDVKTAEIVGPLHSITVKPHSSGTWAVSGGGGSAFLMELFGFLLSLIPY